jgi:hypothetical protein
MKATTPLSTDQHVVIRVQCTAPQEQSHDSTALSAECNVDRRTSCWLLCSAAYLLRPRGWGGTALLMIGGLPAWGLATGPLAAGAGGLAAGALGVFLGALAGRACWSASTTAGITIWAFFFSSFLGKMAWELSICRPGQPACQHSQHVSTKRRQQQALNCKPTWTKPAQTICGC